MRSDLPGTHVRLITGQSPTKAGGIIVIEHLALGTAIKLPENWEEKNRPDGCM